MKKVLVLVLLLAVAVGGVFAEKADYFTFTMGAGSGYNITGSAVTAGTVFGVDYTFNDTFTGGFKFYDVAGNNLQLINMTVTPADKMNLSLYSGVLGADAAFGVGFGYDIFTKKSALFSKLSINVDWLATSGAVGTYDVANGGVILFGLRTQVGL